MTHSIPLCMQRWRGRGSRMRKAPRTARGTQRNPQSYACRSNSGTPCGRKTNAGHCLPQRILFNVQTTIEYVLYGAPQKKHPNTQREPLVGSLPKKIPVVSSMETKTGETRSLILARKLAPSSKLTNFMNSAYNSVDCTPPVGTTKQYRPKRSCSFQ